MTKINSNPNVSIIIVNYKVASLIIDCVNSIEEKTKKVSYEIIVVDNNSQDGSVSMLKENLGDRILLIEADKNLGFGKANNLGARYAKGDYLFLLNPDTILINDAISILHDYLRTHEAVGVIVGNLYDETGKKAAPSFSKEFDSIASEKESSSYIGILKRRLNRNKNQKQRDDFNYTDQPVAVSYIFGADMMMPKEVFDRVHGFDEDFFMYAEEAELQWRIFRLGYKIVNCPEAKIIHLEGRSTREQNAFSNNQFIMRMNGKMLFFDKVYGKGSAEKFYRYRKRRYQRQLFIAKLRNNKTVIRQLERMIQLADSVYSEYTENGRKK